MNKTTLRVKGMHCRSCEMRIENELLRVQGVKRAEADHRNGRVDLYHRKERLPQDRLETAVEAAGYEVGEDDRPFLSKDIDDYAHLAMAAIALIVLYYVFSYLGLFNVAVAPTGDSTSLLVVLLVGLTAGLSTCMALVGGLVLGVSARFAEKHPKATPAQRFKPHLLFNLGRIASFTFLGGVIGYLGSFFRLSGTTMGLLTLAAAGVMILMGLQLIELFPRLSAISFTMPKGVSRALGIQTRKEGEYSSRGSAILGGLTFFLPCGFTQAMQLYAVSSGTFVTGALTMGVFALGTTPGLLGVGGLTALVRGAFAKPFYKFVGLAVIALALFNASNAITLAGWNLPMPSGAGRTAAAGAAGPSVPVENGFQVVRMTQKSYGYEPNVFTIAKDTPVRWIIYSEDPYSCASSIVSEGLGIEAGLRAGENVIEFTPRREGLVGFSCWMGMYNGAFYVVDGGSAQPTS